MPKYLFILFFLFSFYKGFTQLQAFAGNSQIVCYNTTTLVVGGTPSATGGRAPYTYHWEPNVFLNSTSVANPTVTSITSTIEYTLTVTDADNNTAQSIITLSLDEGYTFNAGQNVGYCFGQQASVQIGATTNNTNNSNNFSWLPTLGLDDPTLPQPFATPTVTTVYELTVSGANCPNSVTQVTVTPFYPPSISAGKDTTIEEGATITLNAIGTGTLYWLPDYNIKYGDTKHPDVNPNEDTSYVVVLKDENGCYNADTIRVSVSKGAVLIFYSAFTPNKDGDNDLFYIANAEKYPDNSLKIYNRYGKLIYSAGGYANTWDSSYFGNEAPTGTYFYTFFDGIGKTYKGTVTIIR